jgi:hypothetical protein
MPSGETALAAPVEVAAWWTSDATVVCRVPPAARPGAARVALSNDGGFAYSAPLPFTLEAPPTVSSVLPPSGALAGGARLRVRGTGFRATAGLRCTFLDVAEAPALFVSANEVICVAPPAARAGAVRLGVRLGEGDAPSGAPDATSDGEFVYVLDAILAAVEPSVFDAATGGVVALRGEGFAEGLACVFLPERTRGATGASEEEGGGADAGAFLPSSARIVVANVSSASSARCAVPAEDEASVAGALELALLSGGAALLATPTEVAATALSATRARIALVPHPLPVFATPLTVHEDGEVSVTAARLSPLSAAGGSLAARFRAEAGGRAVRAASVSVIRPDSLALRLPASMPPGR